MASSRGGILRAGEMEAVWFSVRHQVGDVEIISNVGTMEEEQTRF